MKRRDFIRTLGLLGAAQVGLAEAMPFAALNVPAQFFGTHSSAASLQSLAANRGLMFGSCLALKYCVQSVIYQQLFLSQCGMATPEVHMKWSSLSQQPGVYDFAAADKFVDFCAANHLAVRGHTLIWHDSLPAWVTQQLNAINAQPMGAQPSGGQQLMVEHIRKVAGRYAGKLYSWDVVNEVLDPGGHRPDGLRDSPWLRSCGVNYLELAFRTAAVADPHALLIWNETYLELSNGFGQAKRAAMLQLLDGLLARGVPIHGIGLEAHLRAEQAAALGDHSYELFLAELGKRGMRIFITELDVQDGTLPGDTATRDRAVAEIYRRFLSATLRQPAVRGIVTWGLADSFTWIAGYRPRPDGLAVRPLPFDTDCQPKAAYYAIAETLQAAVRRSA